MRTAHLVSFSPAPPASNLTAPRGGAGSEAWRRLAELGAPKARGWRGAAPTPRAVGLVFETTGWPRPTGKKPGHPSLPRQLYFIAKFVVLTALTLPRPHTARI